jgi:hypothetical protein
MGAIERLAEEYRDDRLPRRKSLGRKSLARRPTQCRCVLPEIPGRMPPCPDDFDNEDMLCTSCRKIHKPLFPEDWHIG